jgi:DNA repair exonuclease SbcCD nuclease subunit
MKVFCFGDIHIGSSRYSFVEQQEDRISEWVVDAVKGYGCERVIFLGDVFKDRMHSGRDKDKAWEIFKGIAGVCDVVVIAGNHDYYDKQCRESGLKVFRGLEGVEVVDGGVVVESVGGKELLYVPWSWVVSEGRCRIEGYVAFGHFELKEAVRWEGSDQVDLEYLSGVDLVVSGHLHFRKRVGNVVYPGVVFQRSFGDGIEVGGVVVDLDTLKCEWVDGYGVKMLEAEDAEVLGECGRGCYVRVKDMKVVEKVKELGVVGVEYIPERINSYDAERFKDWDKEIKELDLWSMLDEYGKSVLGVGEREIEWLKSVCGRKEQGI